MAAAAAMHIIEFMQSYRHMHVHISSSHVSCLLLHVSQIEPKIQIVSKLHMISVKPTLMRVKIGK